MKDSIYLIDSLVENKMLDEEELKTLLVSSDIKINEYLRKRAEGISAKSFRNKVFLRGLIEYTNYCKNDCFYCGIRHSNLKIERYALNKKEIMNCCHYAYEAGLRTFVIQGGEDEALSDEWLVELIRDIKSEYPDCAVTLSIGEKSRESLEAYFKAGADRYLLRHETATEEHYRKLHPESQELKNRMACIDDLKEIGFQFGAGFMVGSPFQTVEHLVNDFAYLRELNPHMIGVGPFIRHKDTPFSEEPDGSVELTLKCISILRIMFPHALIPATTALATADGSGFVNGILAGANVIMPNITPSRARINYVLYDNKLGTESNIEDDIKAKCHDINNMLKNIGYSTIVSRGDYAGWRRK